MTSGLFISILISLALSSCSQKPEAENALPIYSDMGAADDAGKAK